MPKLLLKNATLVTPERIIRNDLMTDGDFISKIAPDIKADGAKVIDCTGLIVMPGLIDEHVHFRDPGLRQKGTMRSESRAAVLGGVTSVMDMPNCLPPTLTRETLEQKKLTAQKDCVCNYAFYLGAGNNNLEEIKSIDPKEIAGVKIFMGSSTGNMLIDEEELLLKIFCASRTLIAVHCESTPEILANEKKAKAIYGDNIPFDMHPLIRSRDCCIKSSALAIELAKASGARMHLMHVSTKEEVDMLKQYVFGNVRNRQISGEACLPHLYFSESFYQSLGGFIKCNPAIKTEQDRLSIIQGLNDGVLTTVGTDHAPHELAAKTGPYTKCASGMPSVQFLLPALCELWKRGEITLESISRFASSQVAERYRIKNRGKIQEGFYADLCAIDPLKRFTVRRDMVKSLCRWSPFEGQSLACSVRHTIVSGKLVVADGRLVSDECGQSLSFDR